LAIRHYVLLATDGFTALPEESGACPENRRLVYVFGFVGGLYKVGNRVINPYLNWENPRNWAGLQALKGTADLPSPMIWGEVGDRIYVTLINLGMQYRPDLLDLHTVHLHGAHVATQLDGFPETSFGVPMWSMLPPDQVPNYKPPAATYYFAPDHPGTYFYHCHIEAAEHVQMGMYGSLIIYPSKESLKEVGIVQNQLGEWFHYGERQFQIPRTATNRNFAYNNINTYFDSEWVLLLSDLDSNWHDAVQEGKEFNPVDFRPNYWLVNGRAFPDTLLPHPLTPPPTANKNLRQVTYESYVHVKTNDKFLLRVMNLGYQVVPWHVHGWHFTVIGKDTHPSPFLDVSSHMGAEGSFVPWADPIDYGSGIKGNGTDNGGKRTSKKGKFSRAGTDPLHGVREEMFTVSIGSGESYDLLLVADDKRPEYYQYITDGQDGFPSLCTQIQELQDFADAHPELVDGSPIFDIPTEPVKCPNPDLTDYVSICSGIQSRDRFFPQFYPAHNHDDYKVTNNGVYPGGQLILMQIDPPGYDPRDDDD